MGASRLSTSAEPAGCPSLVSWTSWSRCASVDHRPHSSATASVGRRHLGHPPASACRTRWIVMSVNARRLDSGKVVYDVRLRTPAGVNYKRTFRTKREAELFEAKERTERHRGAWVDPAGGRVSLDDYAKRWLRERSGLRPRTVELYEGLLRL